MSENKDKKGGRIHIVGPGAMGSTLGVCLQDRFQVGFSDKNGLAAHTTTLVQGGRDLHATFPLPDPIREPMIYLFPVKAFDLEQAMM